MSRGTCGNRKESYSTRLSVAFCGGTIERTILDPQKLAMTGFEKLDVWKSGCRLAVEVYSELQNSRDYGLRDQMQRAAVSIPSNIAEGSERKGTKEFIQFLYIAKGSCAELRTQLYIASCIGAISASSVSKLTGETKRIAAMLSSLINTLEQKHKIKS